MDCLRFGTVGLTAAEDTLIATLFRLYRVEPSFIWTLATAAPYHALLIDARCASGMFEPLLSPGTQIQRLGNVDSQQPGELVRPIRSDLLVRWLKAIEIDFLRGSRGPLVATSPAPAVTPSSVTPRPRLPVPAPPQAVPVPPDLAPGAWWKLRSWPPRALLAGDARHIRMATMLSRRALSVSALSAATGISASRCASFVAALHQAGLLDAAVPPAKSAPAMAAGAGVTAPTAGGLGRSLLRSIRQRLGI